MLYVVSNIIGADQFQACARKYLDDHHFGVADTDTLITYFSDAIKKVRNNVLEHRLIFIIL